MSVTPQSGSAEERYLLEMGPVAYLRQIGEPGLAAVECEREQEDEEDYAARLASRWPCGCCGGHPVPWPGDSGPTPFDLGADPCLGWLPGVEFACCGHGGEGRPYVSFATPFIRSSPGLCRSLYGEAALDYFRSLGVGPSLERKAA